MSPPRPRQATAPAHQPSLVKGDRVAVTGAAGFIGSAVVRALLAHGADVVALVEPGGDERNLDGLRRRTCHGRRTGRQSRHGRVRERPLHLPPGRDVPVLGQAAEGLLRRQRGRRAQCPRGRPPGRVRARRLHEHRGGHRPGGRRPRSGGGRELLRRRGAPLRALQADQVRRRARGAAGRRAGGAGFTGAAHLPPRARRHETDANGETGPRVPQWPGSRICRHHPERGPCGRSGHGSPVGPRTGRHRAELHHRRGEPGHGLFLAALAQCTNLPVPTLQVPRSVALGVGALSQLVEGRLLRREPSVALEAARMSTTNMLFNDQRARDELGHSPRPASEAFVDSARWFVENGYVSPKRAARIRFPSPAEAP